MPDEKPKLTKERVAVLDRVIKLQAVTTDSGATPDEADTAQRLAGKQMAKHGVAQSEVDTRIEMLSAAAETARFLRNFMANFWSPPSRAEVAEKHKLNAKKFRKWLRERPEINAKWDKLTRDEQSVNELVEEYRAWGGT